MIRSLLTALLTLGLAAAPALARDNRLVSRLYNKDEIVRVEARIGVQAVISFGEDELIENVAIGDSTNWQITPNKRANLLFVKPVVQRARTNLTVVTDRHIYFFDLVAGGSAAPVYELRFTYPPSPKPAAGATATPALTPEESAIAQGGVNAVPVDPAQLNFAWRMTGSSRIMPSRIFDDGQSTYLSWPSGVSLPAILMRDPKGAEGPVNFSVRGDVIAVDGVPALLVLRSGREQAMLEYKGVPRVEPAAPTAPPLPMGDKGN